MIKKISMLVIFIICIIDCGAQTASYIGTIGKYKIIMELNTEDGENYTGRYRYNGQTQWITLIGKAEGLALYLKEFVKGKNTGIIDLVFDDTNASGSWRKSKTDIPLTIQLSFMEDGTHTNVHDPIPDNLTGHYEFHPIIDNENFPEDYKNDLPFGELNINQISDRDIEFDLQYTSGYPDYHQALIKERATSLDGGKVYEYYSYLKDYDKEEKCKVTLILKGKDIYLKGALGPQCGSGANANPEGLYKKSD